MSCFDVIFFLFLHNVQRTAQQQSIRFQRVLNVYDAVNGRIFRRKTIDASRRLKQEEWKRREEKGKWLWLFNILALSSHKLLRTAGGWRETMERMFFACEELETKSDKKVFPLLCCFGSRGIFMSLESFSSSSSCSGLFSGILPPTDISHTFQFRCARRR